MTNKTEEFKKELKALLEKHDAYLWADIGEGSDTHGIYDEHMGVSFIARSADGRRIFNDESHRISEEWEIEDGDL